MFVSEEDNMCMVQHIYVLQAEMAHSAKMFSEYTL